MKTIEIKGSFRTELGKKSSKEIRKEGNVPCVIYGKEKNIHFFAHENSFKNLVYTTPLDPKRCKFSPAKPILLPFKFAGLRGR